MKNRLFSTGPVQSTQVIKLAASNQLIDERCKEFQEILTSLSSSLMDITNFIGAKNVYLTGSITAACESVVVNLLQNQKTLVLSNGYFGDRWIEILEQYDCDYAVLRKKTAFSMDDVGDLDQFDALVMTHCESSTGVVNDLSFTKNLGGKTVVVDAATTVGVVPIDIATSGVDVLVFGSQKGLMSHPGLSVVQIKSELLCATNDVRAGYYLSWDNIVFSDDNLSGITRWTPALGIINQLEIAVKGIDVEHSFKNSVRNANLFRSGLKESIRVITPNEGVNVLVTCISLPDYLDANVVLRTCQEKYGVQFAPGLTKDNDLRIGHFGSIDIFDTFNAMLALDLTITALSGNRLIDIEAAREQILRVATYDD